ncbi:MAG: hypothetical protein ACRDVG_07700 [Jatrophihabitantaceae bacterium]
MTTARSSDRKAPVWVTALLGVLALVLIVVAVLYFAEAADKLPSFFPGHTAHGQKARTKHGIAAAVVAVIVIIAAWFSGSRKRVG